MVRILAWCEPDDERRTRLALGELAGGIRSVSSTATLVETTAADLLLIWDQNVNETVTLERVQRLRSRGARLPILVIARQWNHLGAVRLLDCGADDCLIGETWDIELRARVCALVRRALGIWLATDDGSLRLNREALAASICGCHIALTPTQFAILDYLVCHRDRWISSDTIIQDVLGTCHQRGNSVVRFHVHGIRRALGEAHSCIRWERGKGYMFVHTNACGRSESSAPDKPGTTGV